MAQYQSLLLSTRIPTSACTIPVYEKNSVLYTRVEKARSVDHVYDCTRAFVYNLHVAAASDVTAKQWSEQPHYDNRSFAKLLKVKFIKNYMARYDTGIFIL